LQGDPAFLFRPLSYETIGGLRKHILLRLPRPDVVTPKTPAEKLPVLKSEGEFAFREVFSRLKAALRKFNVLQTPLINRR
jgi:hypothetical protein